MVATLIFFIDITVRISPTGNCYGCASLTALKNIVMSSREEIAMKKTFKNAFVVMAILAPTLCRAADGEKPASGVRTTVSFEAQRLCTASPTTVNDLGDAFYSKSSDDYFRTLAETLTKCEILRTSDNYVVIVLPAKPTSGAEKPNLVHTLLKSGTDIREVTGFAGTNTATWVYLTDDKSDVIRVQLSSAKSDNPTISDVGPLVEKIVTGIPAAAAIKTLSATPARAAPPPPPPGKTLYIFAAHSVKLPFKRAAISESDFVARATTKEGKPATEQFEGEATVGNVPHTWVTLHAGVGMLPGKLHGAKPAKVDDGQYASDPLKRAATFAGVTVHPPFDSTSPETTGREKLGFVIGGVLTPAAGLYIGPSVGWRGFAITVGPIWMWTQTTPDAFNIGDQAKKKSEGGPDEQLVYKGLRGLMIGATYAFGK